MVKNKTIHVILIKCPLITYMQVCTSVAIYQEEKGWSVFES